MRILTAAILTAVLSCGTDEEHSMTAGAPSVPSSSLAFIDSIGVELGDSAYMFGAIADLTYGPGDRIVLLDRAFSRVLVYSRDGEYLRQIGRQGDGPGEMSLTVRMAVTGQGDLLVSQRDAMERFDFESGQWVCEYPRGVTPPPFVMAGMPDSSFVGVHLDILPEEGRMMAEVVLGIYLPGEAVPEVILESSTFQLDPMNGAFLFEKVLDGYSVAVDGNGTVYVAQRSGTEYEVTGYHRSGQQVFRLHRDDVQPVEMTSLELEEEKEFLETRLASMGAEGQRCSPDPLLPMISGLGTGPEGNLWIRRGNVRTPRFDVYNTSGELLENVDIPVDPEEGRYWMVSVQPSGILAYCDNPVRGFQKVYMLE
jgi:hypothetical protein